jgi:PleD family two-component response regulator
MDKWQITLRVEGIRREILQIREANRNYKAHTTHHVTTRTQEVHPNRMAKTILIADDSDVVRRAVCEAFALESDFEVCGEAHDGHDAIEKAQRLHPDLIILDLSMPVMNGLKRLGCFGIYCLPYRLSYSHCTVM